MGVFGLLLATVGNEPVSGMMRFTFGNRGMETGIDMLPLVVGVFPLAEVFYRIYEERSSVKAVPIDCRTIVFPRLSEWKRALRRAAPLERHRHPDRHPAWDGADGGDLHQLRVGQAQL